MPRVQIDCSQSNWQSLLESALRVASEADLSNFDFNQHGEFCVKVANQYHAEFRLSREPGTKEASFRNPLR